MRKKIWIGLLLILFIGCDKNNEPNSLSSNDLRINLVMSPISSKAIDDSAKGYILPYSDIATLRIELYGSLDGNPIFTFTPSSEQLDKIKATHASDPAVVDINKAPNATKYAKVIINEQAGDPDINTLQPGAFPLSKFSYEGTSNEITIPSDSKGIYVVATIFVKPAMTRFEIIADSLYFVSPDVEPVATRNDPNEGKYVFDRTEGSEGRNKILGFTEEDIKNGENSALIDYENRHGHAAVDPIYGYAVEVIYRYPILNITNADITAYVNYFKASCNGKLVKHENDGSAGDSWNWASSQYHPTGKYSNMTTPEIEKILSPKVCAFNLFPQFASKPDDLSAVKQEMPHIIFRLPLNSVSGVDTNPRWLTIRAFTNKATGDRITSFEPGMNYQLRMSDMPMTMWTLQLKVDVRGRDGNTGKSDPIIEDKDPSSNLPEPKDRGLTIGLTVSPWIDYDIITDL